jgi:carbamoylphosphate synthase large subunit
MLKSIILGGTEDHIALIENLKNRGYYTILIDYYDNPPAKKVADLHIKESTLQQERVLEIASDLDVDLIISACIDQALLTACYVAEKLGLPAPFNYETALNVTNKGYMKKRMVENGIPTSKYYLIKLLPEIQPLDLEYPIMVKPADSNGSFGVKKAHNTEELNQYVINALEISRSSTSIIEEFNTGIEVSVDCFVEDGIAKVIMMSQLLKKQIDASTMLIFQSTIPAEISDNAKMKIEEIANGIAKSFGLDNTPLLIQTIVNGDEVNVIEFSPRIGGTKHKAIKEITNFDILNASIDSYLGKKVQVEYNQPKCYTSKNHIYTYPGVLGDIANYEYLLNKEIITDFIFFKTKGMKIGEDLASRNRVASFVVKSDTKKELFRKVRQAVEILEVYDINGNPIMRKDIFQGEKI